MNEHSDGHDDDRRRAGLIAVMFVVVAIASGAGFGYLAQQVAAQRDCESTVTHQAVLRDLVRQATPMARRDPVTLPSAPGVPEPVRAYIEELVNSGVDGRGDGQPDTRQRLLAQIPPLHCVGGHAIPKE